MRLLLKTKSTKTIIFLLFCILTLFCINTIVYSAFSSTMNITGIAKSRVEADVRITNFSLYEVSNSTTAYEEFSKNTVSSQVSFNESDSYVVYKIETTNYGAEEVGIHNISGFPENTPYQIIDYNLKDKICDRENKCTNYATKVFYIKFTGSNTDIEFTLNFDFRVYHTITYKNFTNTYPSEIMDGDSIEIDMSEEKPNFVHIQAEKNVNYLYQNNILKINEITQDIIVESIENAIYEYSQVNNAQEFKTPYTGLYKVELWGSGAEIRGDAIYPETVGKGAYTSGTIYLQKDQILYLYVGGTVNSFNGAGPGESYGGGATDIRLTSGSWDNFESLKSRIMVAAGGGSGIIGVYAGTARPYQGNSPGDAGGLDGYSANYNTSNCGYGYSGYGATQTSGGAPGKASTTDTPSASAWGQFGIGGHMGARSSGGGSGYYGGGHGIHTSIAWPGGGGGSSFISGHEGCNAIAESSTSSNIIHTYQEIHYSGLKFRNTKMIDGRGYSWTTTKGSQTGMPTVTGTSTMNGNVDQGYAKISLLDIGEQYEISYYGITGEYQPYVNVGDDVTIDFGTNAPNSIGVIVNNEVKEHTYQNGILNIKNIQGEVKIYGSGATFEYGYSGNSQLFQPPLDGIYKVELWGAGGGYIGNGGYTTSSLGGYTSGNIVLDKNDSLYVYIGENGANSTNGKFNGTQTNPSYSSSLINDGGGATDIRLVNGNWYGFDSLKSRIMVAAGAGSGGWNSRGGEGGGLQGYTSTMYHVAAGSNYMGKGATQTTGGLGGENTTSINGKFGIGSICLGSPKQAGQGGGGYYGGGSGYGVTGTDHGAGGGGSSFISGHSGCDAIAENSIESNIIHTGQSIHYSNYSFTDTIMIDGKGYSWTTTKGSSVVGMPTYSGSGTMTGNSGHGYAKITLIEVK